MKPGALFTLAKMSSLKLAKFSSQMERLFPVGGRAAICFFNKFARVLRNVDDTSARSTTRLKMRMSYNSVTASWKGKHGKPPEVIRSSRKIFKPLAMVIWGVFRLLLAFD